MTIPLIKKILYDHAIQKFLQNEPVILDLDDATDVESSKPACCLLENKGVFKLYHFIFSKVAHINPFICLCRCAVFSFKVLETNKN